MLLKRLMLVFALFLLIPSVLGATTIQLTNLGDTWAGNTNPITDFSAAVTMRTTNDGSQSDFNWNMFNNSIPSGNTILECYLNYTFTDFAATYTHAIRGINTTLNTSTESEILYNLHPCTDTSLPYPFLGRPNVCSSEFSTRVVSANTNYGFNVTNLTIQMYNRGQKNFTFMSIAYTSDPNAHTFATKEAVTEATRPNMSCTYASAAPPPTTTILTLTAIDKWDSLTITNYSVLVYNGSNQIFSTLNGTIPISNLSNSIFYNLTFFTNANGTFYNATYLNVNVSGQSLQANMSKFFKIYQSIQNNTKTYDLSNFTYVRNLTFYINLTCNSLYNSSVLMYINNTINTTYQYNCNNETLILNNHFVYSREDHYSISFIFNNSFVPLHNTVTFGNNTYLSDLNSPNVTYLNTTQARGFGTPFLNISINCTDKVFSNLTYNVTFNNVNLFNNNLSRNTLKKLDANSTFGNNTLTGRCSDLFSADEDSLTRVIYTNTLILVTETNNSDFDATNPNSTKIYFDDNSTLFDFKKNNTNIVNFTTFLNDKLRIEFIYSDGTTITRYIDVSLSTTAEIRICANYQGTTHYEQLIISASQRKAVLKNVFSNCIIASDYTRFAYQDAFLLKAYSIASLYYLYTTIDGADVFLASLDGSTAAFINLDTLEFKKKGYNLNIQGEALDFYKTGTTQFTIVYLNNKKDNSNILARITRMDTSSIVFTQDSFTNPNNFTLVFDYSTLSNVTNSTLFMFELEKTSTSGVTSTIKRYLNIQGQSGIIENGFAFIISFILVIFGLTFVASRYAFGWFGIIIMLAAIVVLGMAIGAWYITLLMAIDIIMLVWIVILLVIQNYPTIAT